MKTIGRPTALAFSTADAAIVRSTGLTISTLSIKALTWPSWTDCWFCESTTSSSPPSFFISKTMLLRTPFMKVSSNL